MRIRNQYRMTADGIYQTIAAILQRSQFYRSMVQTQPDDEQFLLHTVTGGRTKYRRQQEIRPAGCRQQYSHVHIGVEYSARHRDTAASQRG